MGPRARAALAAVLLIAGGCAVGLLVRPDSRTFFPGQDHGAGAAGNFPSGPLVARPPSFESVFGAHGATAPSGEATLADVAAAVTPSVVNIYALKVSRTPFANDPFWEWFFGRRQVPRERREQSLGSGVIVSQDGYVLTNNHVVEGAAEIVVALPSGREFKASLVGRDEESDVAVLDIEGDDFPALPFGDSSKLRVGDAVLAVGNPFGVGQTVTFGIVSALGRQGVSGSGYESFIQTDAAINPGNSGGALVNLSGELIGINTAIISRTGGYQGIGFANPSNLVKTVMSAIIENGGAGAGQRGFLGVNTAPVTEEASRKYRVPAGTKGALILSVVPRSPADKAGLEEGDVVTAIDGTSVTSPEDLRNVIGLSGAGRTVTFEILREGAKETRKVRLSAREAGR
ncbi:MAG: trypsin-like peptidase domain-containing protein [Planctomycetes bacterium]|nr:trypsin-like peptidase domain-containing protein [Planctomycetota bacterium]